MEQTVKKGEIYSKADGVNFPEITAKVDDVQKGYVRYQKGSYTEVFFVDTIVHFLFEYPYKVA